MFSQSNELSSSRGGVKCNKSPNLFCFLCSIFIASKSKIYSQTEANRTLYSDCYGASVKQNGADKFYSPNVFCASCMTNMKNHIKSNKTMPLKYSSPSIWKQPNHSFSKHEGSCFVCLARRTQGARFQVSYEWPNNCQHNVIQPILNTFSNIESGCSAPKAARYEHYSSSTLHESDSESDEEYPTHPQSNSREFIPYDQAALNQLVKDLGLTKDQSMVLASNMRKHNVLTVDCRILFFKKRNWDILGLFDEHNGVPYLKDIRGFFKWLNYEYVADQWRLFMDSSKSAFKVVLLHNGNLLPSIPLLYSPTLKETYADIKYALDLINYRAHQWKVIADLKLLNVICGIGTPSVRNPCILCDWYGTHRSNKQELQYHQNTQRRTDFIVGQHSVVAEPLIDITDVLLPPLHVKIGLVAQFIKKLAADGPAYQFICKLLSHKSSKKLEAGQLDGPEIRKLLKREHSEMFENHLSSKEKRAWIAFKNVCTNFLGKTRAENYKEIASELVQSYEAMGCNMSYKLHVMDKHIEDFPRSCSDFSDEMGERFHQEIKSAERIYQGRYDKYMLSDYCWFLKAEAAINSRKGRRRSQFPFNALQS